MSNTVNIYEKPKSEKIYSTLTVGESTIVNDVKVMRVNGDLKSGDMYLAERNQGPCLLTVDFIHDEGWVVPQDKFQYCYDTHECIKVVKA